MKRLAPAAFLALCLSAQTFDVASVKPSDQGMMPLRVGPIELSTRGTLKQLIVQAYEINYLDYRDAVLGGSEWTQSESYDVVARVETPSSPHEINVMLQALLAERFQLKLHRETKIMLGYALVVDMDGAKLPPPKAGMAPDDMGVIQMRGGEIWSRSATMENLANGLRYKLGFPVVDETKIEGHYDFKLQFGEENAQEPAISIFTVLRELGLRLDSRKLPFEVFVIDSAERPSAN